MYTYAWIQTIGTESPLSCGKVYIGGCQIHVERLNERRIRKTGMLGYINNYHTSYKELYDIKRKGCREERKKE